MNGTIYHGRTGQIFFLLTLDLENFLTSGNKEITPNPHAWVKVSGVVLLI